MKQFTKVKGSVKGSTSRRTTFNSGDRLILRTALRLLKKAKKVKEERGRKGLQRQGWEHTLRIARLLADYALSVAVSGKLV